MEVYKTRRGGTGNNDVTNGELKRLYADNGTVAENNFIQLIAGDITGVDFPNKKTPVVIDMQDAGAGASISAVALTDNIALLIYSRQYTYTVSGETRTIAAPRLRLATVIKGVITPSTVLDVDPLSSGSMPIIANHVFAQRLSDTRALIFCGRTRTVGHSFIAEISGNNLIAGAAIETGRPELLDDQRFIAISAPSQIRLETRVFKITQRTITAESAAQFISPPLTQGLQAAQAMRLTESKAMLLCTVDRWVGSELGNRNMFFAASATISADGVVSAGAWSQIGTGVSSTADITCTPLSEAAALVAYGQNGVLTAGICQIAQNNSVIIGGITSNRAGVYAGGYCISAVTLASDKALITASGATGYTGTVAAISGNALSLSAYTQIAPSSPMGATAELQSHNWILCAFATGNEFAAVLIPTTQKPPRVRLSSADKIDGITQTACTAATAGEVWILRQ